MAEENKKSYFVQKKMKKYFKENKIKQVDVALGIGMPPATLSEILNCKRKLEVGEFFDICDFINANPQKFKRTEQ